MVLAQCPQCCDMAFCKFAHIKLEWCCGDLYTETIGQERPGTARDDGGEVDFDLAASHLAARAMQTRVLWVCSTLGLAGIIILATRLAKPSARLSPGAVPALSQLFSPG